MHLVLDRREAEFVRRPVHQAPLHASPRQPHGEAVMVVIAAIHLARVGSGLRQLDGRRPPEFTSPDHQCFSQQTPLLQVDQQRANRLVALPRQPTVIDLDVVVVVPRLSRAMPQLHVPHPAFDQPAGNQDLPGVRPAAIEIVNVLRLARDVEGVGRLHLHAVGQFERLDPRLQLRLVRPLLGVPAVHPLHQVQLPSLLRSRPPRIADVGNQLVDLRMLRVDIRPLKHPGQKRRLPILGVLDRVAPGTHRHEARKILILGPQPIGDPRPHAGPDLRLVAAVHQHQRRFMVGHIRVHRADHAQLIRRFRHVRKQLADLDPRLPMLLKAKRRGKRRTGLPLGPQVFRREVLPGVLLERGLGVERIHVRRPAVEKDVNHMLRPGGKLRLPRQHRIPTPQRTLPPQTTLPGRPLGILQHPRETEQPHPQARSPQELPPRRTRSSPLEWKALHHLTPSSQTHNQTRPPPPHSNPRNCAALSPVFYPPNRPLGTLIGRDGPAPRQSSPRSPVSWMCHQDPLYPNHRAQLADRAMARPELGNVDRSRPEVSACYSDAIASAIPHSQFPANSVGAV